MDSKEATNNSLEEATSPKEESCFSWYPFFMAGVSAYGVWFATNNGHLAIAFMFGFVAILFTLCTAADHIAKAIRER